MRLIFKNFLFNWQKQQNINNIKHEICCPAGGGTLKAQKSAVTAGWNAPNSGELNR